MQCRKAVILEMTAKICGEARKTVVILEMTDKICEESAKMSVILKMTAKICGGSAKMSVILKMTDKIYGEARKNGRHRSKGISSHAEHKQKASVIMLRSIVFQFNLDLIIWL
ncbi:hypothetical protein [Gracilibacillus phocaeensis]|uniref:hypothetical protein n=1 Tax=Gracilibacillus phocaeensis TaxID=2042304 RepID=UPI0010317EB3|nr:hypothetical protein [Gracilibacillus phocaeensis]